MESAPVRGRVVETPRDTGWAGMGHRPGPAVTVPEGPGRGTHPGHEHRGRLLR